MRYFSRLGIKGLLSLPPPLGIVCRCCCFVFENTDLLRYNNPGIPSRLLMHGLKDEWTRCLLLILPTACYKDFFRVLDIFYSQNIGKFKKAYMEAKCQDKQIYCNLRI